MRGRRDEESGRDRNELKEGEADGQGKKGGEGRDDGRKDEK